MKEIGRDAGLSIGAAYVHYKSKDILTHELFIKAWGQMAEELRRRAARHAKLDDKLEDMVSYVFELLESDPDLVAFVYLQRHQNLGRLNWGKPNPFVVFHLLIRQAIKKGEIPEQDVNLSTSMVMGAIVQTVDISLLGGVFKQPREEIVSGLTDKLMSMLKGPMKGC